MAGLELDQASKLPVSPSHKTNSTFSPLKPLSNPEENAGSKACIWNKACRDLLRIPPSLVRLHISSSLGHGNGQACKST